MPISSIEAPIVLAVLKVAVVALVGFMLAWRGILHSGALSDLSNLVILVAVPCLNFANAAAGFTGLSVQSSALAILGAPFVLAVGFVAAQTLGRLTRVAPEHWRPVVCASTFQNANYLPIAITTSVLPSLAALFPSGTATMPAMIAGNGVVTISLFAMLYSPLFWGLGFWWLTAKPGESAATGSEFRLKLLPPPVVGVLLGYLFGITPLHLMLTPAKAPLHFVFEGIRDIASVSIPLANLVLGGMLAAAVKGRLVRWRNVVTVTSVKLVIVPLAALGLLRLLLPWWRHDAALAVAAFVVFVEAISPPATNLAIMSKQSALAASGADVVPGLLLVNYSLALITMPLWLTLFFQLLTH